MGLDARTPGSRPEPKADAHPLSPQGPRACACKRCRNPRGETWVSEEVCWSCPIQLRVSSRGVTQTCSAGQQHQHLEIIRNANHLASPASRIRNSGGAQVAQSTKHPTLSFCSGHNLRVDPKSSPKPSPVGLLAQQGICSKVSLSFSLCPSALK